MSQCERGASTIHQHHLGLVRDAMTQIIPDLPGLTCEPARPQETFWAHFNPRCHRFKDSARALTPAVLFWFHESIVFAGPTRIRTTCRRNQSLHLLVNEDGSSGTDHPGRSPREAIWIWPLPCRSESEPHFFLK